MPPVTLARRLRREPTAAERHLWPALRTDALGAKFRRQHPVGPYVADFACVPAKLILELDGGIHAHRTTEDQHRTEALERMGWRVLRLPNAMVLHDLSQALALIHQALHP